MHARRLAIRLGLGTALMGLAMASAVPATAATAPPAVAPETAVAPAAADPAATGDEPCETLLEGVHCFNFGPERVSATYRWLGEEPIRGRLQLGRSTLPAPGCDVGQPVAASPVLTLDPGDAIVIFTPQARAANWSNAFLEVDQQGRTIGVRSVFCSAWLGD